MKSLKLLLIGVMLLVFVSYVRSSQPFPPRMLIPLCSGERFSLYDIALGIIILVTARALPLAARPW